jgi:hypothetical protein
MSGIGATGQSDIPKRDEPSGRWGRMRQQAIAARTKSVAMRGCR